MTWSTGHRTVQLGSRCTYFLCADRRAAAAALSKAFERTGMHTTAGQLPCAWRRILSFPMEGMNPWADTNKSAGGLGGLGREAGAVDDDADAEACA